MSPLGLGFAARLAILTVYGLSRLLSDAADLAKTEVNSPDQPPRLDISDRGIARLHVGLYFHGLSSLVCRCIRA